MIIPEKSQSQPRRDNNKVRQDAKLLTLDSFIEPSVVNSENQLSSRQSVKRKAELNLTLGGATKRQKLELDSMKELQSERSKCSDEDLAQILSGCSLGSLLLNLLLSPFTMIPE